MTAEEIIRAINQGASGVWTLRPEGTSYAQLQAFQPSAKAVIEEAQRLGYRAKVQLNCDYSVGLRDLVVVEAKRRTSTIF